MAADPAPREELHRLIDQLEDENVEELRRLARRFRDLEDPMLALFRSAPPDDEPLTTEDEAAIEEARRDVRAGRLRPLNEALSEADEGSD
jgi:hypothetical protein